MKKMLTKAQIPQSRRPRRAALLALLTVGVAALGASAFASVTIYENDFKQKHEFKTISKAAGGKACDRFWHKQKAFGISVGRRTECAYQVPVFADGSGGDMTVKTSFKIFSEGTTKKTRRGAFAFLSMRASNSARYQLRVFPKARRWELRRTPSSGDFPIKGKLKKMAPLDKRNTVQMRVVDDTIDVWVQGKRVVRAKADSDAAEVDGDSIRLGIAQANKGKRATTGIVNLVRVDLPNP